MRIKDVLVEFNDTGICVVDVDKLISGFTPLLQANNQLLQISQWHDEYRLVRYKDDMKGVDGKLTISEEQAKQIINGLNLSSIDSPMFNHAKTWVLCSLKT
jgi:hypothetical protein